jgi:hypothetical protein
MSCNQFVKDKVLRVNTTVNQHLILNTRNTNRSSDFCYPGNVVTEDGGARTCQCGNPES